MISEKPAVSPPDPEGLLADMLKVGARLAGERIVEAMRDVDPTHMCTVFVGIADGRSRQPSRA